MTASRRETEPRTTGFTDDRKRHLKAWGTLADLPDYPGQAAARKSSSLERAMETEKSQVEGARTHLKS